MALRMASRRAAGQLRYSPAFFSSNRLFQSSGPDAQQGAPKPVPMSKLKDSFLDGTSSTYLEDMEEKYRQDPNSVDKSWASFFRSLGTHFLRLHHLEMHVESSINIDSAERMAALATLVVVTVILTQALSSVSQYKLCRIWCRT